MRLSTCRRGILSPLLAVTAAGVRAEAQGPRLVEVEPFVELPAGVRYPEGLAANPGNGEIYVSDSFQGALYRIANATRRAACSVPPAAWCRASGCRSATWPCR